MKNLKLLLAFSTLSVLLFSACDKNDDGATEQELITTVQLTFTESPSATVTEFSVVDADGDGGNPPVGEEITLKSNTTYTVRVEFLDESDANLVLDLTTEVLEESAAHLVCYTATGAVISPVITDSDNNGQALGLAAALTTVGIGSGTLQVVLKHEPDKSATDPCATGETDVEVTFEVVIQ